MRNCVRVAQQTLTLYVWVRILVPQPMAPTHSGLFFRGVAQFGSALRSGRRGRRFKSCHLDQKGGFYRLLFFCNQIAGEDTTSAIICISK